MRKKILLLILLVAFFYRIRGLFNPLLDYHSWRQTDTATVAYNFYSTDMNILKPRLNVFPEIRELEFHIYPYIVAILYRIFGFYEFIGKLVSIFFGLGTIVFLYLLTKKYFDEDVALFSAAFFAVSPMAVYYNRTFMPESTMLFFSVATLYFLTNWLENRKIINYFLSILFFSLAMLTKATSLYLVFPIIYLFVCEKKKVSTYCLLHLFLSLIPPFLWYYYQHQIYMSAVGGQSIWHVGTDKWFNKDILLNLNFYRRIWLQHLGELHFAYTGYLFFFIGLFSHLKEKQKVFRIWVFAVFFYFIVVAVGNYVHEYYQLPILLPGSVFVGLGIVRMIEKIKNSTKYKVLLEIIMVVFLLWLPIYGYTKSRERMRFCYVYKAAAEKLAEVSSPQDKIIVVSSGQPEVLYYSRRKGWHFRYDIDENKIKDCISNGAKYLVYVAKEKKYSSSLKKIDLPKFDDDKKVINSINNWEVIKRCVVNTDFVCIWEI